MDHDNLARSVHVMTTLTPTLLLTVIRKCESFMKSCADDPITSSSNENDIMLILHLYSLIYNIFMTHCSSKSVLVTLNLK